MVDGTKYRMMVGIRGNANAGILAKLKYGEYGMSEWIKMTRRQLDKLARHLSHKPKIEAEGLNLIVSYEKNCTYNSDQIESDMVSVIFIIEPDGTETQIKSRVYKRYPSGWIARDPWDWMSGYDRSRG